MYILKREVLALRRSAAPLSTPLRMLADARCDLSPRTSAITSATLATTWPRSSSRWPHSTTCSTHSSPTWPQVSVGQNEDIRKISAWVAIAAVPTLVASIYGMNFEHMPELHWRFGYPLIIGAMLLFCIGLYRSFKRNGWL
jgi:magnesium transporter